MTKVYPTRLFIKCPTCGYAIIATDDDAHGDYTAICHGSIIPKGIGGHCPNVYFDVLTGHLRPTTIEILNVLTSNQFLNSQGLYIKDGKELIPEEWNISFDLAEALVNDCFLLVRTDDDPMPMVESKYPIFDSHPKYGEVDIDGTVFKVVVANYYQSLLDEAVKYFTPPPRCMCGADASHECNDDPCCGGMMCCPDTNK
jgi:hypothetical protein